MSAATNPTNGMIEDSAAPTDFTIFDAASVCVRACYLHGHQGVVDPILLHQLAVSAQFRDFTFVEASDDIGVPDGGESVGNDDGGSTESHLQANSDEGMMGNTGSAP